MSRQRTTVRSLPLAKKDDVRRSNERRRVKLLSEDSKLRLEVKTYLRVCEGVGTPRALACYLLAKSGEWHQLLSLPAIDNTICSVITVPGYRSAHDYAGDYSVTVMMTKNPRLPLGIDRSSVASSAFDESELLCSQTNVRFRRYAADPERHTSEWTRILRVRQICEHSLGPLSRKKLDQLPTLCRFGPGASTSVSGNHVVPSRKFTCEMHVTPRLKEYAATLFSERCLERAPLEEYRYSHYSTVPKNAKTDRSICIEPHLNVYAQLGVGALLRDCLRRLGLEPDSQLRNRTMAQAAVHTDYATIDMSMASDLISSQVVFALLPDEWFHLLHLTRTDCVKKDGAVRRLEKFSSMGNGFTWELQSLIFYSIARSLTDKPLGVFGDDLVVPCEIVEALLEVLNFFGFRVNDRKSFWQGGFRESCGSDYFNGFNVRPFFFKRKDSHRDTEATFRIHLANGIRIMAHRFCGGYGCDSRFSLAHRFVSGHAEVRKTFIPLGFGDGGLIVNFDEAAPRIAPRGFEGFECRVYGSRPLKSRYTDSDGALFRALHSPNLSARSLANRKLTEDTSSYMHETVRGRTGIPALQRQIVPYWYNLGPWV